MVNIDLSEAKRIAEKMGINVTTMTLTKWIRDNGLGTQPGGTRGRWFIHAEKFKAFLKGEPYAPLEKDRNERFKGKNIPRKIKIEDCCGADCGKEDK